MKQTVICLGELLIDFVPETSGLALSDVAGFRRAAGGAPANVAAAVARLGGTSRFIGKVGADPFGDYLQDTLAAVGVDVASTLLRTSEAQTGLAFVSLRADGERDFLFYRSPAADTLLASEELDAGMFADAAVYHFGSVSLISEPCRSATETAAKHAREAGAFVSFDPNIRLTLWSEASAARRTILERMALADLVKTSEEEMIFLTGEPDMKAGASRLLELGPQVVVVTMGAKGSRTITRATDVFVPTANVASVDATGAGDAFVGGLLYKLTRQGVSAPNAVDAFSDTAFTEETLRFANTAGALSTTKRGAIPALPTLGEVEAMLASGRE